MPVEGGVPIISGGKLIGALGISGGSSAEDEFSVRRPALLLWVENRAV